MTKFAIKEAVSMHADLRFVVRMPSAQQAGMLEDARVCQELLETQQHHVVHVRMLKFAFL